VLQDEASLPAVPAAGYPLDRHVTDRVFHRVPAPSISPRLVSCRAARVISIVVACRRDERSLIRHSPAKRLQIWYPFRSIDACREVVVQHVQPQHFYQPRMSERVMRPLPAERQGG
jgi:hypothetical protein